MWQLAHQIAHHVHPHIHHLSDFAHHTPHFSGRSVVRPSLCFHDSYSALRSSSFRELLPSRSSRSQAPSKLLNSSLSSRHNIHNNPVKNKSQAFVKNIKPHNILFGSPLPSSLLEQLKQPHSISAIGEHSPLSTPTTWPYIFDDRHSKFDFEYPDHHYEGTDTKPAQHAEVPPEPEAKPIIDASQGQQQLTTTEVAEAPPAHHDSLHQKMKKHIGTVNTWIIYLGGASIVSFYFRTLLFGKTIFMVEYPNGNLTTVRIRRHSISSLQNAIIKTQPPPFPGAEWSPDDVKYLSLFIAPQFAEPLVMDRDIAKIPDEGWVFWSREDEEIPQHGMDLEGKLQRRENYFDKAVQYIAQVYIPNFTTEQQDQAIDLCLERNAEFLQLWKRWRHDPEAFGVAVAEFLARRDEEMKKKQPLQQLQEALTQQETR